MVSDKILVQKSVYNKTPEVLRTLPAGPYRVTKSKYRDDHSGPQYLPAQFSHTGDVKIIDWNGSPCLCVQDTYGGGLVTSGIVEAARKSTNIIDILTENSHYVLEGPLLEYIEEDCE